ncbi:MAG: Dabb family protein [Chloroflexota bacterium]
MVTHIIFMKFKDKAHAEEVKARLSALPAQIEQIKTYEIGIDELDTARSFHLSLYSQFDSYETLKIYSEHPAHVEVLDYIKTVVETVHAVDYTV